MGRWAVYDTVYDTVILPVGLKPSALSPYYTSSFFVAYLPVDQEDVVGVTLVVLDAAMPDLF